MKREREGVAGDGGPRRPQASHNLELCFAPAHRLAGLIAEGQLSSHCLVKAVVDRARTVQPTVNCFSVPLFEEALTAALQADAVAARGDELGPLHGIPITVKDGVATARHLQTFGSATHAQTVAANDDLVWQRLQAAGAILIGKTATPEFFHKVTTDSPLFGVTRNPWNLALTPGGSSGGAAAALCVGVGPLAVGSDGGGSLRCPAACTGILALKPTMGRVPHGSFPDTFGNYATFGPMARDARDLSTMLRIMSGSSPDDAASIRVPPLTPGSHAAAVNVPLRVGWVADPGGYGVNPEIARCALDTLTRLAERDIIFDRLDGSCLDGAFAIYRVIASVGHASRARTQSKAAQTLWSDSFRALVKQGLSYEASELQAAQEARTKLFRSVQALFQMVDVIATPTVTAPPKDVGWDGSVGGEAYAEWAAALYPFNLTGHPAISVPSGFTADGLPVGLQFVAPWYSEDLLLRLASAIEKVKPWAELRPPL